MLNAALLKTVDETLRFQLVNRGVFRSGAERRTDWIALPVDVVAFMLRGVGKISFRESGETCSLGEGDAVLSPAGMVRRNRFAPVDGELVVVWAHLRYEIMRGVNPLTLFRFPKVFAGDAAAAIGRALGELAAVDGDPAKASVSSIAKVKALGMELLAGLTAGCEAREDAQASLNQYRTQSDIVGHIEDHLREKITVAELARLSHLSVSRFHRVFKGATGRSPTDFIIDRRVQTARRLLATTSLSLAEIADATGFASVYYFSRMFRQFAGSSPSAYRKAAPSGDSFF